MKKYTFLLLVAMVFSVLAGSGQSNEDSLKSLLSSSQSHTDYVDLLNRIAVIYYNGDTDSLMKYGSLALARSKEINYAIGMAEAYKSMGTAYVPFSRYDSALLYLDSALRIAQKAKNEYLVSEVHNGIGIASEESGNYAKALNHYFQSESFKRKIGDLAGIGKVHNNIGKAYYSLGVYDSATSYLIKALENETYLRSPDKGSFAMMNLASVKTSLGEFEEARKLFLQSLANKKENNDLVQIATINGWLGEINLMTGKTDEALKNYLISLGQFQALKHLKGIAALRAKVGEVYLEKQLYDSAMMFFRSALTDKNTIGDRQDVPALMVSIARAHRGNRDRQKAIFTTLEAIRVAETIDSKSELVKAYKFLNTLYSELGQIEKAYDALQQFLVYKDEMLNEQKLKEIKTLETVYGVKQLHQAKEHLEQERATQDLIYTAELQKQNILKYSSMGGLILVMLLAITYYHSYQRKKKANTLLEGKNKLITSQKEFLQEQSTELHRINSELEELSSFKEGLTQMIAHDMKNPLNAIIALSDGKVDAESQKTIKQSGREMLNLVTNMLDIQKFEEARMELNKVALPVTKLFRETLQQTDLLFTSKALKHELSVAEGSVVAGDRQLLERVLVNLLTNAVKYSSVGGVVRLSSKPIKGKFIQLAVADEGTGIAAENLAHIFDKFWQTEAKNSGKSSSTGLGLTFCKMAIEAHGGEITVNSVPGKGSTFVITLPESKTLSMEETLDKTDNVALTPSFTEDFEVVSDYLPQLAELQVHQISQIKKLLNEIESHPLKSPWVHQLKAAIFNSDQKKYHELILELTNNRPSNH